MKKIILALFLMLYIASMASAAKFYVIANNEDYTISIDLESLMDQLGAATCWTKWVPKGEELKRYNKITGKEVSYLLDFTAYALYQHQYQSLESHVYYKDGKHDIIFKQKISNAWEEIIPDSQIELIWNIVKFKVFQWRNSQ